MAGRDWARLLLLATLWSASFLLAEIALRGFGPLTIAAGRVGVGALLLLGWMSARGPTALPFAQWRACLVMGLLNNALPFTLIFWAQQGIESGLAAILNATTPLFTAVIAASFGQERLTGRRLAALALGVAGVAILIGPEVLRSAHSALLSEAAVLLAALSYAAAGVFGRRRLAGLAPDAATCGMLLGSSVLMIPAALFVERPWEARPSPEAVVAVLALAAFGTALAYGLYFRILKSAGATNLLLVTLLMPAGALILGVLFLDERAGLVQLAGLALILLALALIDGRLVTRFRATSRRAAAT
ncbi:MAG: EamA family transporter [Rhodospirillales bacterium]|nr:EamA family transporter [Rhodospirillales bacterium]